MTTATQHAELMHFCAPTPHGTLHLKLPARHGSDAVGAALTLTEAEPLLLALEQWLALALDPTPLSSPATPPPGLLWCSAPGDAHLGLPWQLLAQAPPSGMPALHGPDLQLQVDVARWPLLPTPPASSALSTTAALLLLPASFDGSWRVTLVQAEFGFEVDAHWAGPGHAPTLAGAPRAVGGGAGAGAGAETRVAAVRLLHTLCWPMSAVLGWSQPPDTPLSDRAQAWPAGATRAAFSGRIVPALGGAGLLVEPGAVDAAAGTSTDAAVGSTLEASAA